LQRAAAPVAWRYTTPAIVLHWLLAALILFMVSLGWWMMTVEREPEGPRWFALHKSVGLVLLALVALRVLWRLAHRPQPLPAGVPRWQVLLSGVTQVALYLLMIAVPLAGLLGAMYSRSGLTFFGTDLPRWVAADRPTAKQFFELHETLVWLLVACVALHVAGGLKHLVVDRDQVFARMWPARR
jgi:cytochrome b561